MSTSGGGEGVCRKSGIFLKSSSITEMQYFFIARFISYSARHFRMVFFLNFVCFSES